MSKAKMVVAPPPVVVDDTNLSRAWARGCRCRFSMVPAPRSRR